MLDLADRHGYPRAASDRQKSSFDAECARYLAEQAELPFSECCRPGVWAYFSLVLLPDLVGWRFSREARERWVGGVRNTFGTLWKRGYLIGAAQGGLDARWDLVERLTQDAFVQITERPGLAGNPRVARAIATGWVDLAGEVGQGRMEPIARTAIRWLGAYRRAYDLDSVEQEVLEKWVKAMFQRAARYEGGLS